MEKFGKKAGKTNISTLINSCYLYLSINRKKTLFLEQ